MIVCPLMGAVTYLDEKRDVRTYRITQLELHGCDRELESRLRYALSMVTRLISYKSGSTAPGSTAPVSMEPASAAQSRAPSVTS